MQPEVFRKVVMRNEPFTIHWGGVHRCWIAQVESPQIKPYCG